MQCHYSSSIDTLKENLLRAVDAEYNVLKPDLVLDIISQLEQMVITKDQLQATRLGREINTIRQKIDTRKMDIPSSELMIEIAQRTKKLLRSWQGLLNTTSITHSPSTMTIDSDMKPRLILKVKLNSSLSKRKRNSTSHKIDVKRKKSTIIEPSLPRLKTTQELLLEMQTPSSIVSAISPEPIPDETVQLTSRTSSEPLSSIEQSTDHHLDLSTICASFQTVADLVEDHRRRMLIEHDSREIEARPDLLLPPLDQLAYVYEREKLRQIQPPTSSTSTSSITTVEKLTSPSDFLALPFIDCPMEFHLTLDELIVEQVPIEM